MLHVFLHTNRTELVARCQAKGALSPAPLQIPIAMEHGIPKFLDQLIDILRKDADWTTSGPHATPGRPRLLLTEVSASATKHGGELLREGFTVDQVVHNYGDLCQAITELAVERNQPIDADEFRTLNGCLDDAIADAVTEYGRQNKADLESDNQALSERLTFLAHEMRTCLNAAQLSYAAIKGGHVGLSGATAEVLDRNILSLRNLIDRELVRLRLAAGVPPRLYPVAIDRLIHDVQVTATLDARARGCGFSAEPVEPGLAAKVDQPLLHAAISNLLHNAFRFTPRHTHVTLRAYPEGDRVLIEVEDKCGGLPGEVVESFAHPVGEAQAGAEHGLPVTRLAVEFLGGELRLRNLPNVGCVFTIDLPCHRVSVEEAAAA